MASDGNFQHASKFDTPSLPMLPDPQTDVPKAPMSNTLESEGTE